MKRFFLGLALTGMFFAAMLSTSIVITGCKSPTQQKVAVNTLFSLHKAADLALDDYLDLVNKGTLATNSVPKVLTAYTTFQAAYNSAVVLVASGTNIVAPQSVVDAAAAFASTVTSAKKGSL